MRTFILVTFLLCLPGAALALETRSLPPSPPDASSGGDYPAPGRTNLTEAWRDSGAARLYWNSLAVPRQMQMGGASFRDPASVPELPLERPAPKKAEASKKRSGKATASAKPSIIQNTPPADAGSTALKAPAAAPAQGQIPTQNDAANAIPPVAPAPAPAFVPSPDPPLTK